MSVTHYEGSRGPVEIATMPLPYASNALEKLKRDRVDAARDPEIEALGAHVARLAEEWAEQEAARAPEPEAQIDLEDAIRELDTAGIAL